MVKGCMPGFSPCEAPILTLSTPGGGTRTRGLGFLGTQGGVPSMGVWALGVTSCSQV